MPEKLPCPFADSGDVCASAAGQSARFGKTPDSVSCHDGPPQAHNFLNVIRNTRNHIQKTDTVYAQFQFCPFRLCMTAKTGVQQRYTPQLSPRRSSSAKLWFVSYLGLRSITLVFYVLSQTYGNGSGLIIPKLRSISVGYGPLR